MQHHLHCQQTKSVSERHLKQTYKDKESIIESLTEPKIANCIAVYLRDEEQAKLTGSHEPLK